MGVGHCGVDSVGPMSNAGGGVESSSHVFRAGEKVEGDACNTVVVL